MKTNPCLSLLSGARNTEILLMSTKKIKWINTYTECIVEPFKFGDRGNHPKGLRNKGKEHISIHRYRKFLLCLKRLPTEQIEMWLLKPHSNKERPSQNRHKITNKRESSMPKAAWNQEETKAFYLAKMKKEKFWCGCQRGACFTATELWKHRTDLPELPSPTQTALAPHHSPAQQHWLLALRSEQKPWCQRNIASKSPGRENIKKRRWGKVALPSASYGCRIQNS